MYAYDFVCVYVYTYYIYIYTDRYDNIDINSMCAFICWLLAGVLLWPAKAVAPHPMGTNIPRLQGVRIVRHMNQQVLASGVWGLPCSKPRHPLSTWPAGCWQKHQHLQPMPAEPARSTSRLRSKSSPATDLAHHYEANQREMVPPTRHVTVKLPSRLQWWSTTITYNCTWWGS